MFARIARRSRRSSLGTAMAVVVLVLAAPGGAGGRADEGPVLAGEGDCRRDGVAVRPHTAAGARPHPGGVPGARHPRGGPRAAGEAYGGAFFDPGSEKLIVGVTNPPCSMPCEQRAPSRGWSPPPTPSSSRICTCSTRAPTPSRRRSPAGESTTPRTASSSTWRAVPRRASRRSWPGWITPRCDTTSPRCRRPPSSSAGWRSSAVTSRCSLGFSARNSSGAVYVLTAGHCTNLGGTWYSNSSHTIPIGPVANSSFPGNDYGRISRTNTTWVPTSKIQGGSSVLGKTVAPVGTSVCRSGSTTGFRCGTVTALNQTVSYAQGCVFQADAHDRVRRGGRFGRTVREQHPPGPGRHVGRQRQLLERRDDVLPAGQRDPDGLRADARDRLIAGDRTPVGPSRAGPTQCCVLRSIRPQR